MPSSHRAPRGYRPVRPVGVGLSFVGIVLAALAYQVAGPGPGPAVPVAPISREVGEQAYVARVVDGDTLLLRDGRRVRLLGVDTPETKKENTPVQPWGPEAAAYTKQRCERQTVRLVGDREKTDRFGRHLAYVYVGDFFLNEALIRNGFSKAQLQYPYRSEMKQVFRAAEADARENRRGIWSGHTR